MVSRVHKLNIAIFLLALSFAIPNGCNEGRMSRFFRSVCSFIVVSMNILASRLMAAAFININITIFVTNGASLLLLLHTSRFCVVTFFVRVRSLLFSYLHRDLHHSMLNANKHFSLFCGFSYSFHFSAFLINNRRKGAQLNGKSLILFANFTSHANGYLWQLCHFTMKAPKQWQRSNGIHTAVHATNQPTTKIHHFTVRNVHCNMHNTHTHIYIYNLFRFRSLAFPLSLTRQHCEHFKLLLLMNSGVYKVGLLSFSIVWWDFPQQWNWLFKYNLHVKRENMRGKTYKKQRIFTFYLSTYELFVLKMLKKFGIFMLWFK